MKKLGNTIIEESVKQDDLFRRRNTIRAVIIKDNKVLMLYSSLFDDYTFPGGGIKNGEDHLEALTRELKEEVGAGIVNIIKPLGYTEEIGYGINSSNNVYLQTSYYYLCEIDDVTEPKYVGREKLQGLETVYIDPKEIIKHNKMVNDKRLKDDNKGFQTVLVRENIVLDYIVEELLK